MQMHLKPGIVPRVFRYSLDWRFLMPLADPRALFVAFQAEPDFSQTLEHIGIPAANLVSVPDIATGTRRIPSLALPFGLPQRVLASQSQLATLRSLHNVLEPGGCFLIGFRNARVPERGATSVDHASTPARIERQLREAGFQSSRIFGAVPGLRIPEYIFELEPSSLHFALSHRLRRKPAMLRMLRIVSGVPGWTALSGWLPCYFAVAVA
jgi:hypothetical protein